MTEKEQDYLYRQREADRDAEKSKHERDERIKKRQNDGDWIGAEIEAWD